MAEGDVSNLRELVAYAIAKGDLSQNPNEETCADVIAALARADALGAALWRVTGNMDPQSFIAARRYLTTRLDESPDNIPTTYAEKNAVAQIVLQEWLACQCERCEGRKYVVNPETKTRSACPECDGTGRGRQKPEQRMAALKVGNASYARLSHVFDLAHRLLNQADARVERQIMYQLERRKPKSSEKTRLSVVK